MLKFAKTAAVAAALLFPVVAQADELKIGGKNFTEQYLLAEMTHQLLEANGFETDKLDGMGSTVLRKAMENDQIDIYWEYTGTSLVVYNKVKERMDAAETYATVKKLDAAKGITWLDASNANNTFAFAVRGEGFEQYNSLSDIAAAYNAGTKPMFSFGAEFSKRPDGLRGLEKAYDFKMGRPNYKMMESGLIYDALREGAVDVGQVFATDGRIAAFNFKVLEDDAGFFPDYALVPTIRTALLDEKPVLGDLLNGLSAKLDDAVMQKLNAQVDVDKRPVEDVAAAFLAEVKLVP